MNRLFAVALACALTTAVGLCQAQASRIPRPESVIGFAVGTDRKLADPAQIEAYFDALSKNSDRLKLTTFGTSTEGRPMLLAIITSPRNHAHLEDLRRLHLSLVDPRSNREGEREKALSEGRAIISMHSSIHSNEVGPAQSAMEIAWRLCNDDDPITRMILDEAIILLNPIHNPDGYERAVNWYRRWVGTPHEGAPMVDLYHKYVGHDNNRDWFMATQQETKATINGIHRRWRPLVALDQHQMDSSGARMFVPPYQEPWDPAIPAGVVARTRELGSAVMKALKVKAREGVVTETLFDAWSPSRSALPYHGGVRFLTEIASARFASPINVRGANPRGGVSYDGPWALGDIVQYNLDAALAAMAHIAQNRRAWLEDFRAGFESEIRKGPESTGFVIRHDPTKCFAERALLDVFRYGDVEVSPVIADGIAASGQPLRKGDWVVRSGQPFFPFAESLLRKVDYPEIRDKDGKIRPPYDVTVNHLPTLLGLDAIEARGIPAALTGSPKQEDHKSVPPLPLPSSDIVDESLKRLRDQSLAVRQRVSILYNSDPLMAEGWLRWWFDSNQLPVTSVADQGIFANADARTRNIEPDAGPLILPGQSDASLRNGPSASLLPSEYMVGLGIGVGSGAARVKTWVEAGGHLVAIGPSTAWAIREFGLPVTNVLNRTDISINLPGTAVAIDIATSLPFLAGLPSQAIVMANRPQGFAIRADSDGRDVVAIARYASLLRQVPQRGESQPTSVPNLVRAGYAVGADIVAESMAVLRIRVGAGTVTLIGFDPVFRGWTIDAWPLFARCLLKPTG